MTEVELLALNELPEHLIIIGGGYIGLEFGQMFRRFGAEVTIIAGGGVAGREDEDVSALIAEMLTEDGVESSRVDRPASDHTTPASRWSWATDRRSRDHICWWQPGASPTRICSVTMGSRPTSAASSRSARVSRPRFPASGRWATSTAAAPSRTPRTRTRRSCWPRRVRSTAGSPSMRCSPIRRWDGSG